MKQRIQFSLLAIAICLALIISLFGAGEIANWLKNLGNSQITPQDVYSRVLLFLLATFFVEILLERLTTFNKIDTIEGNVDKITKKVAAVPDEIANIKEELNHIGSTVDTFFRRFNDRKHHRFHELSWKYMFRGAATQEGAYTFAVNRMNSLSLWRDCISEADIWEAISYARDLWQNDEQEISKAHQDVHIKLGGLLYRIFVFDTEEEFRDFRSDPQKQEILSGGDIRWILKSALITSVEERLKIDLGRVGLIDFAIGDTNSYILWFQLLDSTKRLDRAVLTIDSVMIERSRAIFDVAFANAKRFAQSEARTDKILDLNKRRLQILQEKKAFQGAQTDPAILIEIEDLERQIRNIEE